MLEPLVQKVRRNKPKAPSGLKHPPKLSGGLPLVGHTVEFVRSAIGLLERAYLEGGEIVGFEVLGRRMVALFGPDAHEAVFRAPESQLSPQEAYKIMTPIFGKGMVYDAKPEVMNEQLKMLLPALKDRRMRTYGEIVVEEVEKSIASWGDEGEIDLVDYCRILTNFTSSHCLLGKEFRGGMSEEFARVYHSLERGIAPIAYINANLPIPSFRERDKARVRLEEMVTKIIQDRRKSGREGEDFLQTLMDAKYKSGAPLTEHEITGMLVAAMFAGHHTSSVTTAWALIELSRHPDYLARVRAELDATFGDGQRPGFYTLRNIPLTEYTVLETLRLHPPLFMLIRVAEQDFTFKGYFIPKGSWLVVSPTVAHLIPEIFKDPTRFDPDRFGPGREEDKRDFAYIPFGGGRHKCMGNAFAILQVKAILTILLRRFEFELVSPNVRSDFHGLVVGPEEPCRIRYKKRQGVKTYVYSDAEGTAPAASERPAKKFRVEVDLDLCQGHAVCMGEAPEIFRVSGLGKVELLNAQPDPSLYGKAKDAEKYCPTRTIKILDVE
jgi:sterol 14-demethylase